MKRPKRKEAGGSPKRRTRKQTVTYTHRDPSGMPWRMVGSRPVSALADKVMAACGLPLR